jgi:hypothetical protein
MTSRWILLRMRNPSDKRRRENQNKWHILYSIIFFNSCHLWDDVEKCCGNIEATDDNTTRRMSIACWVRLHARTHVHTHPYTHAHAPAHPHTIACTHARTHARTRTYAQKYPLYTIDVFTNRPQCYVTLHCPSWVLIYNMWCMTIILSLSPCNFRIFKPRFP